MLKKTLFGLLLTASLTAPFAGLATQYPLTVTDIDGQEIEIKREPQRIVLQDGRDIMALALLDKENPFQRLVAWNNLPKRSDAATWALMTQKWPQAAEILDMGFGDKGEVELESVLSKRPDLMIAQLRAKPSLADNGIINKLKALNIPLVFVDYEVNPVRNTAPSIDLLGKVLNREENAKAYTDFYRRHLADIQKQTASLPVKANVFVEAWAGRSDSCCFSHAHNGWGGLVEAVGARNIGSELLPGANGYVSLEKLISMKPDAYIMTGAKRGKTNGSVNPLPFGLGADEKSIDAQAAILLNRTGVSQIPAVQQKKTYGIYHQFYNNPFNIIGMEYLAKAIYPQQFSTLDPDANYRYVVRHFTGLPDSEFIFFWKPAK
ncbi:MULTISPECIES: ABC transporter substrate-binding protein [Brenneria]|uniref:ABC transporter substrate-binding protein n=1 Tax=Brenneria nigrifluens DSM 30175 = ATCC 13028 TaxID=1121120 RepID=A0A2U1UNC0_9GAMM|nr:MULTISPECIES: ABC transporter substrate-binding protein [Brenneria]EHD20570.1 ABC-type transporter, periplasmic subunit [Brenneria sp. EniD312]PWC23156.1 ABC transporter substrate-binding protein [Brenneria nigrifluens DSM 30175 = ATCC 13028]QCR03754.1 ABC transporter substrate-binding protein [Brenneria nigrifluens DSM 30175 = ATCC 13028]